MLIGALSLGLAGCGGDDTPFPPNVPIDNITLPFTLTSEQAQDTESIPAGQGGTLEVSNLDPGTFGGVISARVTFPLGTSGQTQTFGIAIVPSSRATLNRLKATNPNVFPNRSIENWTNLFEILVGPVLPDGTIDYQNPPNIPLNFSVELSQAQANFLNSQLGGGSQELVAYRIGNNNLVTKVAVPITFDFATRRVNVSNLIGGRFFVASIPTVHDQGGGGS